MKFHWKYILRAEIPPRHPDWIPDEPVLKDRRGSERAFEQVISCSLPPHKDPQKNWDSLYALGTILEYTNRNSRILDAGATLSSRILPWLYLYGYRNLTGINPIFKKKIKRGAITYEKGDIMDTRFPDNSFDVITCLSVIEHGVDVESYLLECYRILKAGGLLITSTDYFDCPVDTGKKVAYGVPIRIFNRNDIEVLLDMAKMIGYTMKELDLKCNEKVVNWVQFDLKYTFLVFTLRKGEETILRDR